MIAMSLKQGQQAWLAGGILLVAVLFFFVILAMPALTQRGEFRVQLDDLQFQYSKFNTIVRQRDTIMADLARLRQEQSSATGFLDEKPEALAAADLQNLIKNLVESHGANLISTQVVQHESSGTFPDVRISIHMRAGIETLREIIHALESGQATLLIDNLYLQKRNTRVARRAAQVMPGGQMEELIEARFEVTGYVYQAETRL